MGLTMQSHILVVCQLLAVTQSAPQVAVDSVVAAAQPPPTAVDPSAVPAVAPSAAVTPAVVPPAASDPTAAQAATDGAVTPLAAEASPPAQNAATENVNELPSVANASSIAIVSSNDSTADMVNAATTGAALASPLPSAVTNPAAAVVVDPSIDTNISATENVSGSVVEVLGDVNGTTHCSCIPDTNKTDTSDNIVTPATESTNGITLSSTSNESPAMPQPAGVQSTTVTPGGTAPVVLPAIPALGGSAAGRKKRDVEVMQPLANPPSPAEVAAVPTPPGDVSIATVQSAGTSEVVTSSIATPAVLDSVQPGSVASEAPQAAERASTVAQTAAPIVAADTVQLETTVVNQTSEENQTASELEPSCRCPPGYKPGPLPTSNVLTKDLNSTEAASPLVPPNPAADTSATPTADGGEVNVSSTTSPNVAATGVTGEAVTQPGALSAITDAAGVAPGVVATAAGTPATDSVPAGAGAAAVAAPVATVSVDPASPAVPAAPSAPTNPAAPSAPTDPTAPNAPADLAAPSALADPAAPGAPTDPAAASTTINPAASPADAVSVSTAPLPIPAALAAIS